MAGVDWVMTPGTDLARSLEARALASAFPGRVLWAAGLHPHDAINWSDQQSRLSALAADADAIGECGLDYYRNLSPVDAQRRAFSDQLDLASILDKPIIVHCRDAFADVFELVGQAGLGERTVLHCWTGGPKWTRRFRDLGVTFSFAGPVTYPTGDTVRRGAAEAPPERTLWRPIRRISPHRRIAICPMSRPTFLRSDRHWPRCGAWRWQRSPG